MLFFRYSQYQYFDPNFIENHLKGWEMIIKNKFLTHEKNLLLLLVLLAVFLSGFNLHAQINEKIWFDGLSFIILLGMQ